jgi:hypothetical protein
MFRWCVKEGLIGDGMKNDFEILLRQGELYKVGFKLEEFLPEETTKQKCLAEVLLQTKVNAICQLIAQIPFHAYITTNYDTVIEDVCVQIGKPLFKFYKKSLLNDIRLLLRQKPFILKLHGDIAEGNPDPIVISNRATRNSMPSTISYPTNMQKIFSGACILLLGFEKADPDLGGLKTFMNEKEKMNYWLIVPEGHVDSNEADTLWSEDGICTVTYPTTDDLATFLQKLYRVSITPQKVEIYISYVSQDEKMKRRLAAHLEVRKYPGLEIHWNDGVVPGGERKEKEIENRLAKAHVVLLLVSVDYLYSIQKQNIEVERAVERDESGDARVIPILLRPCSWQDAPFSDLQVLPRDGMPLYGQREQAYLDVAKEVEEAVIKWVVGD